MTDLSQVWVLADIYEKDITKVRAGTDAIVRVDAYPDRAFNGRVTYIADIIDPQTRSAKARVVVANPGTALKLDMFARVTVPTADARDALLVPVIGVIASIVILGERPTWADITGFAMIFAAAACVLLQPNVRHSDMPE